MIRFTTPDVLERYPNGRIEAPQRYVEYDGQVIVRTRRATHQRWVSEGWDPGPSGDLPYILGDKDCRPMDDIDGGGMNDHLSIREIEVYYVEDDDKVVYEVEPDDGQQTLTEVGSDA